MSYKFLCEKKNNKNKKQKPKINKNVLKFKSNLQFS